MSTSICDVAVALKQQEKMETSFSLIKIYFSLRICMFESFTQKYTRDYTAVYTNGATKQITDIHVALYLM